jgi:hypothetical protein
VLADAVVRMLVQLPKGASVQIFLDGIIEAASLDPTCATSARCGGSMTINGIVVTVPKNLIALFPANALTWQEIFNGGTTTVGSFWVGDVARNGARHPCYLALGSLCGAPRLVSASMGATLLRLSPSKFDGLDYCRM